MSATLPLKTQCKAAVHKGCGTYCLKTNIQTRKRMRIKNSTETFRVICLLTKGSKA